MALKGKLEAVKAAVKKLDDAFAARQARAVEQGYVRDMYSGSTHDIKGFDASLGNSEADWGRGVYSTNSIDDVNANYAGVGPDLTGRIDSEAEQIADYMLDDYDRDLLLEEYGIPLQRYLDDESEVVQEIAAARLTGDAEGGVVYPIKIKDGNYAEIGGSNSTVIYDKDYTDLAAQELGADASEDAIYEYADQLRGSDSEGLYERVHEALQDTDLYQNNQDLSNIMEEVQGSIFEGSLDLDDLDDAIRKHATFSVDDNGDLVSAGGVSSQTLQNLGYDGVIDNKVNSKFGQGRLYGTGMEGLDSTTQHVITFPGKENTIRSTNAMFDPAKADSSDLLAGIANVATPLLKTAAGTGAAYTAGSALAPERAEAGVGGIIKGGRKVFGPWADEVVKLDTPDLKIFQSDKALGKKDYRYISFKDGEPVSTLQFRTEGPRTKKATIGTVRTAPEYRRQGYASRLLERARQDFDIKHSKDLTDDGEAWAKAVKVSVPTAIGLGALAAGGSQDAEAGPIKVLSHIDEAGKAVYKTVIDAWHGSPHKFDKFSMDNIGTGEGAQAYGHGLYFADKKGVAESYRQAGKTFTPADGSIPTYPAYKGVAWHKSEADDIGKKALNYYDDLKHYADNDPKKAAAMIRETYNAPSSPADQKMLNELFDDDPLGILSVDPDPNYVPEELQIADWLERNADDVSIETVGSLNRVELDVDPDTLLDWDKPLSEQPAVMEQLGRLQTPTGNMADDALGYFSRDGFGKKSNPTGSDLMDFLRDQQGSAQGASASAKQAGIPGIRYLDGDSRSAGQGTSNYVMFDDAPISIKERGNADPALLAGTAGATGAGMAELYRAHPDIENMQTWDFVIGNIDDAGFAAEAL